MAIKMNVPKDKDPKKDPVKTGLDYGAHLKSSVEEGPEPGVELKTKPIQGSVTTSKSIKGVQQAEEVTESQTLHSGIFNGGMSITVEGGRTLNLGNFESARVGVSITVPVPGDKDGLNEAYEYATNWVSDKIEEAVKAAKSE